MRVFPALTVPIGNGPRSQLTAAALTTRLLWQIDDRKILPFITFFQFFEQYRETCVSQDLAESFSGNHGTTDLPLGTLIYRKGRPSLPVMKLGKCTSGGNKRKPFLPFPLNTFHALEMQHSPRRRSYRCRRGSMSEHRGPACLPHFPVSNASSLQS